MQKARLEPTADQTFEVVGSGPYDFGQVLDQTRRMQEEGDVEGAFEMSAALLEMLLDLDPEDHLEGSQLLAFDYLAMGEDELFDEVINDVSDKSPAREILLLWSAYRRDGVLPAGELQRFRTHFAPWFAEFTAAEHPADAEYLRDIESEHPTAAAQARELWLQTENLWSLWPVFIEALRASR